MTEYVILRYRVNTYAVTIVSNGGEAMEITPMIDIPSLSMAMSQSTVMNDFGVEDTNIHKR